MRAPNAIARHRRFFSSPIAVLLAAGIVITGMQMVDVKPARSDTVDTPSPLTPTTGKHLGGAPTDPTPQPHGDAQFRGDLDKYAKPPADTDSFTIPNVNLAPNRKLPDGDEQAKSQSKLLPTASSDQADSNGVSSQVAAGPTQQAIITTVKQDTYEDTGQPDPTKLDHLTKLNLGGYNSGNSYQRSLLQFDLSSLPKNIRVTDAYINLYNTPLSTDACTVDTTNFTTAVYAYPVQNAWNQTTVKLPAPTFYTGLNGTHIPYSNYAAQCDAAGHRQASWRGMGTTEVVQDWVTPGSGLTNNGFDLVAYNEGSPNSHKTFASSEYPDASKRPRLVVNYRVLSAAYGPAGSFTRDQSPAQVGVWVKNTSNYTWAAGGNFRLSLAMSVNGTTVSEYPVRWAPNVNVPANTWYEFFPSINIPFQGSYALVWSMIDENAPGHAGLPDGHYYHYGIAPRVDTLYLVPASQIGIDQNASAIQNVNTFTGSYTSGAQDFSIPTAGPALNLSRQYNSRNSKMGLFGWGWTSTYETSLSISGSSIAINYPDGHVEYWIPNSDHKTWSPPPGRAGTLIKAPLGWCAGTGYCFVGTDKVVWGFSSTGQLTSIINPTGMYVSLTYDASHHLSKVQNTTSHRAILFVVNSAGRVTSASSSPDGTTKTFTWKYSYDPSYHYLQYACDPRAANVHCTKYEYQSGALGDANQSELTSIQTPRALAGGYFSTQIKYYASGDAHQGWVRYECDAPVLSDAKKYSTCDTTNPYMWSFVYASAGSNATHYFSAAIAGPCIHAGQSPCNSTLEQRYDSDGRLIVNIDAYKHAKTYIYGGLDGNGIRVSPNLLSSTTDELNHTTSFTYDTNGDVTSKTTDVGVNGSKKAREYFGYYGVNGEDGNGTGAGLLEFHGDARSTSYSDTRYRTYYKYDSYGNKIEEDDPAPIVNPPAGKKCLVNGGDKNLCPIEKQWTYISGAQAAYGYTKCDTTNPVSCAPVGLLSHDVNPRPSTAPDAPVYTASFYDHTGDLREVKDPYGNHVDYTYDGIGRLTEIDSNACATGLGAATTGGNTCTDRNITKTTMAYDELGHVTVITAPRVYDHFDDQACLAKYSTPACWHQSIETKTYDADANLATDEFRDGNKTAFGDPTRLVTYTYDNNDTESTTVTSYPDGKKSATLQKVDAVGNVVQTVDDRGAQTQIDFDFNNRPTDQWILHYDDPQDGTVKPRNIHAGHTTYLANGLVDTQTDSLGHVVKSTYYDNGALKDTTLLGYHVGPAESAGGTRNMLLSSYTYDNIGNVLTSAKGSAGHNSSLTTVTYDGVNRPATVTDNSTPPRVMTYTYDNTGNVLTSILSSGGNSAETSYTYDDNGNNTVTSVSDGIAGKPKVTTTSSYDNYDGAGHVISSVDANGSGPTDTTHMTVNSYDEAGRLYRVVTPKTNVDSVNATTGAVTKTPNVSTFRASEYDAFGNITREGEGVVGLPVTHVTQTNYDPEGHVTQVIHPDYVNPFNTAMTLHPTDLYSYSPTGDLLSQTDANNQTTTYNYDVLGRQWQVVAPPAKAGDDRVSTKRWFDDAGDVTTINVNKYGAADQLGRIAISSYDDLGRQRGSLTYVRPTSVDAHGHSLLATTDYDDQGNTIYQQTPGGSVTTAQYSPSGQLLKGFDPLQKETDYTYDMFSNVVQTVNPLKDWTQNNYDGFGRLTSVEQHDSSTPTVTPETPPNKLVSEVQYTYDAGGNVTGVASPNSLDLTVKDPTPSYQTTYHYDNLNRLTEVDQPYQAAQPAIKVSQGYDASGHLANVTDGRNATTAYTYNSMGSIEKVIEPSTPSYPSIADRTYARSYTISGAPSVDLEPGGVKVSRTYDNLGELTNVVGTGGDANASKTFGYDLYGAQTSFSSPKGTFNLENDERGLVAKVTAPNGAPGSSSFIYNDAGEPTSQTDANGTQNFTWYQNGAAKTVSDPKTGLTNTYSLDDDGRVSKVAFGPGAAPSSNFNYDAQGFVSSDSFKDGAGNQRYGTTYEYDADGNLQQKTVAPATANGGGTNNYTYDEADRLTSWTSPANAKTLYQWDNDGNRISAGGTTYAFDARDRLASDSAGETFKWTARGTLDSETVPGKGTQDFKFDAFDRLINDGQSYTYDALDRIQTQGLQTLAYDGSSSDLTNDGSESFVNASGPLSISKGGSTSLTLTNSHGDLVATAAATGATPGALTSTSDFDPFGNPLASNSTSKVGYQGDLTDSAGLVFMNARWYLPNADTFASRDSVLGDPSTPATLNLYTYAGSNPTSNVDPSGHDYCHNYGREDGTYCYKTGGGYSHTTGTSSGDKACNCSHIVMPPSNTSNLSPIEHANINDFIPKPLATPNSAVASAMCSSHSDRDELRANYGACINEKTNEVLLASDINTFAHEVAAENAQQSAQAKQALESYEKAVAQAKNAGKKSFWQKGLGIVAGVAVSIVGAVGCGAFAVATSGAGAAAAPECLALAAGAGAGVGAWVAGGTRSQIFDAVTEGAGAGYMPGIYIPGESIGDVVDGVKTTANTIANKVRGLFGRDPVLLPEPPPEVQPTGPRVQQPPLTPSKAFPTVGQTEKAFMNHDWENGVAEALPKGTSGAVKLTAPDGAMGVLKIGHLADAAGEVGAYRLSNLMGFDMVPTTTFIQRGAGRFGSIQEFVGNTIDNLPVENYSEAEAHKVAAFDYIIGNLDRNPGNYLTRPDGSIVLVDNEYSFFDRGSQVETKTVFTKYFAGQNINPGVLAQLRQVDPKAAESVLSNTGIAESAVSGTIRRLQELQRDGILRQTPG